LAEPDGAHHEESALGWFWVGLVAVAVVVFPIWVVLTALLAEVQRPNIEAEAPLSAEEAAASDARPPAPLLLSAAEAVVVVAGALSLMGLVAGAGTLWPKRTTKRAATVVMPPAVVTVRVRERATVPSADSPGPSDDDLPSPPESSPEEEDLSALFADPPPGDA
jgi:hypothetical protein